MEFFYSMEFSIGIFYSISRDHKQPIKRSEFNKVLYKKYISPQKAQYKLLILKGGGGEKERGKSTKQRQ
jgi:hypothetical protein